MSESVVAQIIALNSASITELKDMWRNLFDAEPPPFNRRFIEARLAYRIQELKFGGLKRDAIKRLEEIGEQVDGGKVELRKRRTDTRPVAGTKLVRDWQGQPCTVTVGLDHFEYEGKRYKSLSSIARIITGTNRNGWTFFGFPSARGL
jgi:hypothetical protein